MDPPVSREELRKRLREKLKGKRDTRSGGGGGGNEAAPVKKMEEVMLNTFGNDPEALRAVTEVMKDPKKALKELTSKNAVPHEEYSEDEEAPPDVGR